MLSVARIQRALVPLLLVFGMASAQAQTYPDKPIRIIAPTTPGSAADVLARLLAESMSKVMNATFVVENKPGADQVLGLEFVARGAPADGYTVALAGIDALALLPLMKKDLRFNTMRDLTLVAGLGEARYVLAGPASAPYKNFKDLVKAIKAAPGKYSYGASGTAVRIPTLMLMSELGLDMQHVPYKGGGPYSVDMAAGLIHWGFLSESTTTTLKGRVRLYGISGSSRSAINPDVPTFKELGLPKIQGPAYGLAVRAGTPKDIADKLATAAASALQTTEFKARAQAALFYIKYDNADVAQQTLSERFRLYQEATKDIGMQPE